MTPREVVADAYRRVNNTYRPFAEGDLAHWETLEAQTVTELLARSQIAIAAESSWRRESGETGCLFGKKGCPPWGFVNCEACVAF